VNGNDFVKLILESPLHDLMGNTMLITVTGRKTGRKITVPVNYYRDMDELWVMTSRSRKWWQNLRQGANVHLLLHGKNMDGFAQVILDDMLVTAQIADYVKHIPMSAKVLGVRIQDGVANCEDTARVAKQRLFLKICLQCLDVPNKR